MGSLYNVQFANQMSMEINIRICWIIISFPCLLEFRQIMVLQQDRGLLHYIHGVRDLMDAKLPRTGLVGVVQQIGQPTLQISRHVIFSCEDMLKTVSTEPSILIWLCWRRESLLQFKRFWGGLPNMLRNLYERLDAIIWEIGHIMKPYKIAWNSNCQGVYCTATKMKKIFAFLILYTFLKCFRYFWYTPYLVVLQGFSIWS